MSGLERVSVEVREAEALLRWHVAVLQLLGVAQQLVATWVWILQFGQERLGVMVQTEATAATWSGGR